MATNSSAILAGIAGYSGTPSLAFFAPPGTSGPVGVAGTAGVQTVTISGTPTSGTFTLTYAGQTTAPIAYNATAATITSALTALSTVGTGNASTSGSSSPWTVTFSATLAPATMTANGTGLTGGTSPSVAVAVTTPGVQTTNPASAAIPSGFLDAGYCADTGLVRKLAESSKQLFAYGTVSAVRTIISQSATTFDLSFLETNLVSQCVSNRLPLGSLTTDGNGYFQVTTGPARLPHYAAIFDVVDGANIVRFYLPDVAATTLGDETYAAGSEVAHPVTLTAYPDSSGNSIYQNTVVAALH